MDGKPVALAHRQHQSLTLLASASTRAWLCPAWRMSLFFFGAVQRASGPWGRWEAQACLAGPHR